METLVLNIHLLAELRLHWYQYWDSNSNLLYICSTIFLVGPIDQVKSIYKSSSMGTLLTKIICIVVILVMIVLVFCSAFWVSPVIMNY